MFIRSIVYQGGHRRELFHLNRVGLCALFFCLSSAHTYTATRSATTPPPLLPGRGIYKQFNSPPRLFPVTSKTLPIHTTQVTHADTMTTLRKHSVCFLDTLFDSAKTTALQARLYFLRLVHSSTFPYTHHQLVSSFDCRRLSNHRSPQVLFNSAG